MARITKQHGNGVGGGDFRICINIACRSALRAPFLTAESGVVVSQAAV